MAHCKNVHLWDKYGNSRIIATPVSPRGAVHQPTAPPVPALWLVNGPVTHGINGIMLFELYIYFNNFTFEKINRDTDAQ